MGIKLGNIDISSFKLGGDDISIYLGDTKLYPTTPPTPTGNTYTVTIEGVDDGFMTINITWGEEHTTSGATDGTYTYTTSSDSIEVSVPDMSGNFYINPNPLTVTLTPSNPTHTFKYIYD